MVVGVGNSVKIYQIILVLNFRILSNKICRYFLEAALKPPLQWKSGDVTQKSGGFTEPFLNYMKNLTSQGRYHPSLGPLSSTGMYSHFSGIIGVIQLYVASCKLCNMITITCHVLRAADAFLLHCPYFA